MSNTENQRPPLRFICHCCQCHRVGELVRGDPPKPPEGWLEVLVRNECLIVRICPECNTPDQPAKMNQSREV